jgi:uncharacterized membrane protein YfcA
MNKKAAEQQLAIEASATEEGGSAEKEAANAICNGSECSTGSPQTSQEVDDSQGSTSSGGSAERSTPAASPESTPIEASPPQASCEDVTVEEKVFAPIIAVEAVPESSDISVELQAILDEDAVQFPLWSWCLLAPMTIYTVLYAYVKKNGVSTCNPAAYWVWYFSPVFVLSLFMVVTGWILKKKHARRVKAGYVFHGDGEDKPDYRDMKWTDETLKQYPAIAILAGVAAGLLGIGGGMVIGPLFIQLDMQPKVGSASCAFMILWTALSGVVQYAFAGKLGWQFILYGIVVGFVSGQIGQRGVDAMLKKSGRPSFVIFLLGGIVLVACVAMSCTGTYKLITGLSEGNDMFVFDTYDLECHN